MKLTRHNISNTFMIGPVRDSSGNNLTTNIPQTGVRLSKNGAAFAQPSSSSGAVHNENGYFRVFLNNTDLNTLGTIDINLASGNYRLVDNDVISVVSNNFYSAWYDGGAFDSNLVTIEQLDATNQLYDIVRTCLSGDLYAEPSSVSPSSTASLAFKLCMVYKATFNKQDQTSSLFRLYNADNTTIGQQATCSEDGSTFTRNKVVSG